jgi:HK97 family phage portal protein
MFDFLKRNKEQASSNLGYGQSMPMATWQRLFGTSLPALKTIDVNEYNALNIPAVYRAVDVIASSIGSLPIHLKQDGKSLVDDPRYYLLHCRPNINMGKFTFIQTILSHMMLWGNAYAEIQYNAGELSALRLIYPQNVVMKKIINSDDVEYHVTVSGETFTRPSNMIIHFKNLSYDGMLGCSNIAMHRRAMELANKMEAYGDEFFSTAASDAGTLYHPATLSDVARENLKNSMAAKKKDPRSVMLLEEGMKLERNGIPPEDMQFLDSRVFQISEIARMFGVPPVLLFEQSKNTSWGSGIEETVLGFVKFKLNPLVVHIEEELNYKLLSREEQVAGMAFKLSMGGLLRGDSKSRAEYYTKLHGIASLSSNEVRGYEDLPEYEGGDVMRSPLNMEQVGNTSNE